MENSIPGADVFLHVPVSEQILIIDIIKLFAKYYLYLYSWPNDWAGNPLVT